MKKIILLFIFFLCAKSFAQTNGITYQAVILNPSGVKTSDLNNSNLPLANKDICMLFKFVDEFSNTEYQEVIKTKTDPYGMVNLIIGTGTQTAGYATSFSKISWDSVDKSLLVGVNITGDCSSFTEISNQPFNYVPFAYSAINTVNVTGVVAIENGGTNAITVLGAKTNLGLENVDNTADLNKPVSTATQTALGLKEDGSNKSISIITDGNSDIKFPSVKSVKTYVDASSSSNSLALTNEISRATLAENTIAANLLSETARATVAEGNNATAISTETNRATAAETANANAIIAETDRATTAEATKEDAANKSTDGTFATNSDVKFPTEKATKTYVDGTAATVSTALTTEINRATTAEGVLATSITTEVSTRETADATLTTNLNAEVSRATTAETANANAIIAEANRATTAEATKEDAVNKSTDGSFATNSDVKFPTEKATKTYVDGTAATVSTALTTEINRATTAEGVLATSITTEASTRETADATLTTNLNAEVSRATTAETANTNAIIAEANRATTAEATKEDAVNKSTDGTFATNSDVKFPTEKATKTYVDGTAATVSTALTSEINRATTAENAIAANLVSETTRATAAETANANAIIAETDRATTAEATKEDTVNKSTDGTLATNSDVKFPTEKATKTYVDGTAATTSTALTTEINRATTAEGVLATSITTEASTRETADTTLTTNLNSEVSRATAAELANANSIASNTTAINTNATAISDETTRATAAELANANAIVSNTTAINTNATAISDETTRATAAELSNANSIASNTTAINTNATAISDETTRATAAEIVNANAIVSNTTAINTNATAISDETTRATAAEIANANAIVSNTTAINTNATAISDEVATSRAAEAALGTALGLKADLDSPTFTGTPLLPTGTVGVTQPAEDNSLSLATTAFVSDAISAASSSFVNLTTDQNIAGNKIFSSDVNINGVNVGRGKFNENSNTAVGLGALESNAGYANTGIGRAALAANVSGNGNTALGYAALSNNLSGAGNVAFGSQALNTNSTGHQNTVIGQDADVSADGISNAVALGANAIVSESNTIQLGNSLITNIKTSGTITAGTVTYPNTDGTANQVLQTDGSGNLNWVTPTVSGVVPIANGGTGSATQNFVDLTNDQMISGDKRFTANLLVRGSSLGTFGAENSANIGFGIATYGYGDTSTMTNNTAIGNFAFTSSAGSGNTAIGSNALRQGDGGSGDENTAVGLAALTNAQAGNRNTGIGSYSLVLSTGMQNTAVGHRAGFKTTSGNSNTFIGNGADINDQSNGNIENATAIGNEAIVSSSNTIQIGNVNVTAVNTSAVVSASGYKIPSGTSNQYLMADGSVSNNANTSSGRTVLSTALIDFSELNNYDVSNISVLFVRPDSIWTNIYGLQGGVLGQVIHIYSVNNQTSNPNTGLSLWNFDSDPNDGIQKFVAPGNINIDHDQDTTLIFDGTYWRVTKIGM